MENDLLYVTVKKEEPKLIIGCPIKNDLESFKCMLDSLMKSTKAYDKIVLAVGKGTNLETEQFIEDLQLNFEELHLEVSEERFETPLQAYNYLFNKAKEENADILMTQTDVLFPKLYKRDWLLLMKNIAKREEVGAITCINGTGVSGPDYINGLEWLGGWCTYYPFRTIDKLGGYDEGFPNGYGVDIDHSFRIYQSGLKIVKINYWCHHHQENAREHDNSSDTEAQKQESAKYFRKKWKIGEYKEDE